ncbi:MAG: fumarylacetoacetate hydrolase family protein [Anaerolineae bacterium]|nr:fumarylacetoacetate hydrolase family protein [Anaerolineae bacterium]
MKLVTFTYNSRMQMGEIVGDNVYVLSSSDTLRMNEMIRRGITPSRVSQRYPLADITLHAPLRPGKIVAIGRNYAEHAKETGNEPPPRPLIFAKFPSAVIDPGEPITWSESITKEVDWEVELAVIIGKKAHKVSEEDAMKYVFGYTVGNDVSARDLQLRTDGQWTRGKSLDTFCPLGPIIVTRDEIKDPQNLNLKTIVNDEVMQDGNTRDMIFQVPYLIHYISQHFTLEPADIILTGTPSGVGEGRKQYLKDGDVVTCSVEGIGELRNPCKVVE